MSSSRKWKFRVRHIPEAISEARGYVEGLSLDDFRADFKTMDAVLTKLIVTGEAAELVPSEVQDRYVEPYAMPAARAGCSKQLHPERDLSGRASDYFFLQHTSCVLAHPARS